MAASMESQRQKLAADRAEIERSRTTTLAASRGLSALLDLNAREQDFLTHVDEPSPPAPSIFPGSAGVEDYFRIPAADRSWGEYYPEERKARIRQQNEALADRIKASETSVAGFVSEIARLDSEMEAHARQREEHNAQAGRHASMCQSGCHFEHCPHP
jgi:hypothetical protein